MAFFYFILLFDNNTIVSGSLHLLKCYIIFKFDYTAFQIFLDFG